MKKKNILKKFGTVLFCGVIGFSFLTGCGSSNDVTIDMDEKSEEQVVENSNTLGISESEIKIGSSSALTGNAEFLGTELTRGSELYLSKVNSQGGVHGRTINLVKKDDQYNPTLTIKATKELIDENVFCLFDYVGTPTSKQVEPIITENKIPVLGLFTGAEFLRDPVKEEIYNVRASYYDETSAMYEDAVSKRKTRIGVFYQNDAFGLAVLQGVNIAMSSHDKEPVVLATYERSKDVSNDEVDKMVEAKPDTVFMAGTYTQLASFVAKAYEKGLTETSFYTVSFVGSKAYAKEFEQYPEEASSNVYVTQVVPNPLDDSVKVVKEYQEDLAAAYPDVEPNYVSLEGYINAKILVEAFERAGKNVTRETFKETLKEMSGFDVGMEVQVEISETKHQMFDKVFISKLDNGNFSIVN